MISPRCLVLLVSFWLTGAAFAQAPAAPADERAARVAERYKGMLQANPVEGLALDRLWKSYDERGASAELIDEYRRLAEAPGVGAAPTLIYGHLLQRAGRLDEAAANYEHAGTLDPTSPLPPLARAELASARSQPEEAARFFTAALEKLPAGDRRQMEILLKLGTAWMSAAQPVRAAESWDRVIAHDPANMGLRRQLADSFEKNGLPERALVQYDYLAAHADPPERAAALRDLARLHEARGEFDVARDALESGLTLTARDNWLHGDLETRLIRLYQRAERTPELEARWRAAVEAAPRDLGGWLRLEALAQAQGDLDGEGRVLEKLVALAPREREYTLKLARRLTDAGDRARAAALYDGLLKVQPESADLIFARAELDLQLGQPAAAVARIEARVARNPADESVGTPALAFFLEHHLDDAAEKFLRAEAARGPTAEPTLALAKFLFARRKPAEAEAALASWTAQAGTAAARSARWAQAAEIFRAQNLAGEALRGWQEAARLQPQAVAPLLAAGEYLLVRGDKTAAAEQFERAVGLTVGAEQTDVEHKLFEVLQATPESNAATGGRMVTDPPIPGLPEPVRTSGPLGRYLANLAKIAHDAPTSENWLRLARWQSWAHFSEPAIASAQRAVEADPANLAARELWAATATEMHRPQEAESQLKELAERDPGHRNSYLGRLANLKMELGDHDAAVAILDQVQRSAPGSRDALTDLALAQQRSERWYDAAATWERAYALPGSTPAQREDIRRPLLAAYERLGQFPRAVALLAAAVDAQTDLSAKTDLFHELAAFCRQHDSASGLRQEYEKRLAARPDDYFLLTALAELRREDGQEGEAYKLLRRAFYSSPDPARSLRELADEADELGEDNEAITYQRRLIALPNQGTAANFERLAALEDADMDESAAARTWENLAARFPRDTTVLGHAAEYFQKADQLNRARELLRQLVTVDPTDTRRLLTLADLDAEAGDGGTARAHLEDVLARTAPEGADEPLRPPAALAGRDEPLPGFRAGRLALTLRGSPFGRPATPVPPETGEGRLRLQAIEGVSRLLFPKEASAAPAPAGAQAAWLERWRAAAAGGGKNEPLAAFYFSGQRELTMDLLAGWTGRADATGETAAETFLNAGLRLGGYGRLADWAWHAKDQAVAATRGHKLLGALHNYLAAGGKPGPGMVAELFPADVRVREVLWTAAQNAFAASHWYAQAADLGERVLASAPSARANYGVELAEWELYAGHPDRSRDALRQSIDDTEGDSMEMGSPVFAALRGYYRSVPDAARPTFVTEFLGRAAGRGGVARKVIAAILLHGWSGDEAAARRDLDQLLAMRLLAVEPSELSPDIRRWRYLLACGDQLQAWNLSAQAIYLWRRALTEAGALEQPVGDLDNTVTEIRHRLLAAELASAADPFRARVRLQEFLGELSSDAMVVSNVAGQLWTGGQRAGAARLYEILFQNEPANLAYWPNLLQFYRSTDDDDAAERLLGSMLESGRVLPAGTNRAELTCQLALLREKRGDREGACRVLERARLATPGSLRVLFALAETYGRADRWEDAASVWREGLPLDPGHTARLGLADVEEHRGRPGAAVELLRGGLNDGPDPGRTEVVVRLVRSLLADHRPEEACVVASDLVKKGQFEPLPAVSAMLTGGDQRVAARSILTAGVRQAHEPTARFRLQAALAEEWAAPGEDAPGFLRQLRRLAKLSQTSENLRNEYEALIFPLAHQQGADSWLESELQRAWKHGQGDPAAGGQLAGLFLQNHREDALREVVQTIDHRPDLPENLLYTLATSLVESDHAPLALAICERLANRFPQKQEYQLERASALWKSDRRPEAEQCLTNLAETAGYRDDVLDTLAAFYLQHGDKVRAAELVQRIVNGDPMAARSPLSWLQLAAMRLDENHVPEAGRLLRVAYARPACDDLGPLLRYLKASGQLDGEAACQMPAPEFPLTFARRARLLAAVHDELVHSGRSEDGRRLLAANAEFLVATPALVSDLRRGATPATVAAVADCLERAAGERTQIPPSLGHELASLYTQWAVWDANDPATTDNVVAHLSRAVELEPDIFAVAAQLAKACLQRRQPERAAEVLAAFLVPEALPSEREQARRILAAP